MNEDKILHLKRFEIVHLLYVEGPSRFIHIQKQLDMTAGNLASHLRALDGVVTFEKRFVGRTPRTTYRLTPKGRARFLHKIEQLRILLEAIESQPAGKM